MSENHICGLNVFYNDNLFCSFCLTEIRDRERQKTLDEVFKIINKPFEKKILHLKEIKQRLPEKEARKLKYEIDRLTEMYLEIIQELSKLRGRKG